MARKKKITGIDIRDATHIYIATAQCGCNVAASTDLLDKDTANEVRDYILRGYAVSRVTFEEFRSMKFAVDTCGASNCPLARRT